MTAILVAGPRLAGATRVVAALRNRLPEHRVIELAEQAGGEAPAVVVFVVSATAPLTGSDCALLDTVAADTDAVIGVVSKIDVHRTWREVLAADRVLVAERADRYRDMPWVGVAAAPDLGPPAIDDLVTTLRNAIADDTLAQRNQLRAKESQLLAVNDRGESASVTALRDQRAAVLRRYRRNKSERAIAMRSQTQQARVQLCSYARARCAAARTELQNDAAALTRRELAGFPATVRGVAAEVGNDVRNEVTRQLAVVEQFGVADGPPCEVGAASLRPRSAETRLMVLLGAGFGLGVALTVTRLLADFAPQWALGGAIGGGLLGLVVTLWVVSVRGLLRDRAELERWVVEVTAGLRSATEEWVVTQVVAAEASAGRAAAARDVIDGADMEASVARIDAEIREHMVRRGRATAARNRSLAAVRAELDRLKPPIMAF